MPKATAPAAPAATKRANRPAKPQSAKSSKQPAKPQLLVKSGPPKAPPAKHPKPPKPGSPSAAAAASLQPEKLALEALEHVKQLALQPGMRQRLAEEMSKRSGLKFTRQMIERWLLADKPVEPKLGNALLLLIVAHELAPHAVPELRFFTPIGATGKTQTLGQPR